MTWVKRYVRPNPNYREEAAHLPLLLEWLMLGASFLFGDGIISPAISVLAVEGLEVVTPMFRGAVIPITVAILALLSRSLCVTATEYCRAT